ncbi:hypothetical protein B0H17DRAFT_1207494 [Mycena rosella]|uniref:Uncharacterized protein n=1 Tax=Mycena rosella TaxID=1033263 RepID=A0AAD7G7W8_MYCRO|nr:hypothetical protein B0H17DRAFT_1207494 [Mycena rosella]
MAIPGFVSPTLASPWRSGGQRPSTAFLLCRVLVRRSLNERGWRSAFYVAEPRLRSTRPQLGLLYERRDVYRPAYGPTAAQRDDRLICAPGTWTAEECTVSSTLLRVVFPASSICVPALVYLCISTLYVDVVRPRRILSPHPTGPAAISYDVLPVPASIPHHPLPRRTRH